MRKVIIMGAGGRDFHNFNVAIGMTCRRRSSRSRRRRSRASTIASIRRRSPGRGTRGHSDRARGGAHGADPRATHVDEVVLRLLRPVARGRDAQGFDRARCRRRLPLLGPQVDDDPAAASRSSRCAPSAPAAARARPAAVSGRSCSTPGYKVALVRHPMPYGDLEEMRVQRFATLEDIDRSHPTIEEREEYEPPGADGDGHVRRRRLRGDPRSRRRRRRTSSSGTAGTTTSRSSSRTCRSRSSTRSGRATSSNTTRARRTCAWPTSSSSTRSTRPTPSP